MHLSNPGSSHIARSWTARLAAIGAIVAGASALTACGGGASTSSTTLLQLRADSYNTLVPAQAAGTTTSTIAALPGHDPRHTASRESASHRRKRSAACRAAR